MTRKSVIYSLKVLISKTKKCSVLTVSASSTLMDVLENAVKYLEEDKEAEEQEE